MATDPLSRQTTASRKPSRRRVPDCINPLCDRPADGPHAMTIAQVNRGTWYACGPECVVQWLRLSFVRTEARADRAASEVEP